MLIFCAHNVSHAESVLPKNKQELLDKDLSGVVRGFIWDIPKTVILEEEKGTFVGAQDNFEGDILFYLDEIDGLRCTIGYEFKDNKLWRIKIFNEKEYPDRQERVEDLLKIQRSITKRLGNPTKEELLWRNKAEQAYPNSWGWAVYRGELYFSTVWQTKDTKVSTFLGAKEKYNPEMVVTYQKIETEPLQTVDPTEDELFSFDP